MKPNQEMKRLIEEMNAVQKDIEDSVKIGRARIKDLLRMYCRAENKLKKDRLGRR
jgi:hypothetical protein